MSNHFNGRRPTRCHERVVLSARAVEGWWLNDTIVFLQLLLCVLLS